MRNVTWKLAAAVVCLAGAGCEGGDPMQVLAREDNDLVLTVSDGVAPTYAWTGDPALSLTVREDGGEVFWQIEAVDAQEGFSGPVRHGNTPASARVVTQARLLEADRRYTVTVVGVSGTEGRRSFTPSTPSGG